MKFVPEYFQLSMPEIAVTSRYIQNVKSETVIKKKRKKQQITRSLKVEIIPQETRICIVLITTEKMKLTLDSVLRKQENISNEVAKTIDYVKLRIDAFGEIIKIENHQEIFQKWYSVREKLENQFSGKAFDKYLIGVEKKMENHDALLQDFKQYRLFGGLFNKLYFEHSSINSKYNRRERKIENFIFEKDVNFKEVILLDKINSEDISLKINGWFNDSKNNSEEVRTLFKNRNIDTIENSTLLNYSGTYSLNRKSSIVNNMKLEINSSYGTDFQKTINYSLTQE